jgi:hypothetical protein
MTLTSKIAKIVLHPDLILLAHALIMMSMHLNIKSLISIAFDLLMTVSNGRRKTR